MLPNQRLKLLGAPLGPEWQDQLSVLELGAPNGLSPLQLKVVGEETVKTRVATFSCWIVHVTGKGIDERYWLDKDSHEIIRTREPIGSQGIMLVLELDTILPG